MNKNQLSSAHYLKAKILNAMEAQEFTDNCKQILIGNIYPVRGNHITKFLNLFVCFQNLSCRFYTFERLTHRVE
jgi:hypothetical protein